jgi:predicted phage terminase large subunit-like protein
MTSLPSYLEQQAYQYRVEKARNKAEASSRPSITLTAYKYAIHKHYQHAPHLEALDQLLTSITRFVETGGKEGVGRAIIEMPPRHGKTLTTSRLYPTWHIGRNPDHRAILVSYGATLAEKNSRAARNIIRSPEYQAIFPHITLAMDSKSVSAWDIEKRAGGADAMGIGGGVTGKGANILIIDDPVKNREQAESPTWPDKVWDSYTDDLYTRLEPSAGVIVMMTRWHQDDLIGRLLLNEPDKWHRLTLPAIDEHGEALWPERYPVPVLRDIEATLGPYSWSALYQQNPVPAEGGIFKRAWFEPRIEKVPEIVFALRYWDLAMSERTSADYTVGVKVGMGTDGHRYILDVARGQIDWGNLTEYMAGVMLADGPSVAQGIEEKGYMSRAVQALNTDPRLHGYQVWGYPVDKDKVTRALPAAAKCAAGVVHVVNAHWTEPFIDEVCSFPNGTHDDQVDAFAGAEAMMGDSYSEASGGIQYAESQISSSDY